MRLPTLLSLTLATLSLTLALPNPVTVSPRDTNTCFDTKSTTCLGHQAPQTNATAAITKACQQVPSCTPGQTNHGRYTVTGKVPQYTATLYVGDQCGGVQQWGFDACVGLFNQFVNARCGVVYPASGDVFQLGYVRAACDTTFVSFNFGG